MTDTDDTERRLSDALDSAAATVPASTPPTFSWQDGATRRSRRFGSRPLVIAGSGLVAAAAAAAVIVAVASPDGHGTTSSGHGNRAPAVHVPNVRHDQHPQRPQHHHPQSAPRLLLAAAHTTLRTGDKQLADGQYRYIRTTDNEDVLDELWIPKDVSDVWLRRQTTDPDSAPDVWKGRCGDLYADTQDGPKGDPCTRPGNFEDMTPAFVAGLPRDADALYAQLHTFAEGRLNPDKIHDVDFAMFTTINDMLGTGMITSDLTSTLYEVLSRIPGIVVVDGATNSSGVAGTGFQLSSVLGHGSPPYRKTTTIIVDTGSGAYLGYHDVSPDQDYLDAVSTGVADKLAVAGH